MFDIAEFNCTKKQAKGIGLDSLFLFLMNTPMCTLNQGISRREKGVGKNTQSESLCSSVLLDIS